MNTKNALLIIAFWVILVGICLGIYQFFFSSIPIGPFFGQETPTTLSSMADSYDSGNLDKAISGGERIVAGDQSNIDAMLVLAATYAQKGSVAFDETTYGQKAIDMANRVIAIDTSTDIQNSEAYRIIGYANEIMNNFAEARVNYDKAIALDPKNAQAYSNKGHSYDLQGDTKTANVWYDKSLSIDPNGEHALLNKARVQIRQANFDGAIGTLDHLVSVTKNTRFLSEAWQLAAFAYMYQPEKDYDAAYDAITEALGYDDTVPQAWVTRGFIDLYSMFDVETDEEYNGQIADINEAISKALALNPSQASAYYLASRLANFEGKTSVEDEMKKKALAAIPNDITLGEKQKIELRDTITAVYSYSK